MRAGGTRAATVAAVAVGLLLGACGLSGRADVSEPTRVSGVAVVPVGEVVDVEVEGRRFATRCAGDPADASVLLVSGHGLDMDRSWAAVQGRIGSFARVCAYDRLGVGSSGRPPPAQTFDDMAAQLDGVIRALNLGSPVLLVGHSVGGMVAAAFTQRHRDDVAGLLLVDATGPGYPESVLDRLPRRSGARGGRERVGWEDLLRPARNSEHLDGRVAFAAADAFAPMGAVPLVALTHSIPEHLESTSPRQQADLESSWEQGQHRWLALSSQARMERVDLAGSSIQLHQPDLVVERVLELLGG